MKKTKLMRAALLLLVLTLITSCFVGGTFAKYTTSKTGSDIARVAKWGVKITAEGTTFATTYTTDDTSVTGIANSVVSTEDVVAPGTSGKMAAVKLSGTPEVAVNVKCKGAFATTGWTIKVNGVETYYCPLKITVGTTEIEGTGYIGNKEGFEKAVNDEIGKYSKDYGVNTVLSDKTGDSLAVSWEWEFNGNDVNDTALGDLTTAPTVTLAITTTVTQID